MIGWYAAGFNALWILGLGLVTAALSFANYLAHQQKCSFRQALEKAVCRIMIDLGLIFFCLGWAFGAAALWERLVWFVLAFMFALQVWQTAKMGKA